jgi:PEGA domain.
MGNRDWGRWQVIIGSWQLILAIVAICLTLVSIVHEFTPTSTTGDISVDSSPNSASVYLDNNYKGETPKFIENVEQGSHLITLKLKGYEEYSQTTSVNAGKETSISADLTQTPTVSTGNISILSPVGALIYLDGEYKGKVPQFLNKIEPGTHSIILNLKGYEDWSKDISVDAGETASVSPTLTPKETFAGTSEETQTEKQTNDSYTSNSKEVKTPTSVDISQYLDWNFTTSKENFYIDVPEGYSLATVTIGIHNDGSDPISTASSCWKFISDGVSYSCEPVTSAFYTPSQYEVQPGESLTFIVTYLVKGEPTTGSLQYIQPTYYS